MNKLLSSLINISLLFIIGCNGHSGENTGSSSGTSDAVETSLTLLTLDANDSQKLSFTDNEVITVQAKLLDQDGFGISGHRINFSTDLGELSVPASLTNNLGVASTQITNAISDLSAGTIIATSGSLSDEVDFEFIRSDIDEDITELTVKMILSSATDSNSTINQFKTDETVQIQAFLSRNGEALPNEIINFSTTLGQFKTDSSTSLTSENGFAAITLQPTENFVDTVTGAGIVSASLSSDSSISGSLTFQIVEAESVTEQIRIGSFDANDSFTSGVVTVNNDTVEAGDSIEVSVSLVEVADSVDDSAITMNDRVNYPVRVSFSSDCASNDKATIDSSSLSSSGIAIAGYQDISCSNLSDTQDNIYASVELADGIKNAETSIIVKGQKLGTIEFISVSPENIFVQGSGGDSSAKVTFAVKSSADIPIAHQEVHFSTIPEGIHLSRSKANTNSEGEVTTIVSADSFPAVVQVIASATMTIDGEELTDTAVSNNLSINTGLADQSGISIGKDINNIDGNNLDEEVKVTVSLTDSSSNPVVDGTTVNFHAEAGIIESNCKTLNGFCTVSWFNSQNRPDDHRVTIIATAFGNETFFDPDGNKKYDSDGIAFTSEAVSSGFISTPSLTSAGFIDLQEPWLDLNDDRKKDANEPLIYPSSNDGNANGQYNGSHCAGSQCATTTTNNQTINSLAVLRKSTVLLVSSSYNPKFELIDAQANKCEEIASADECDLAYAQDSQGRRGIKDSLIIKDNEYLNLNFRFADSALQNLPLGSQVLITVTDGVELSGEVELDALNSSDSGYTDMEFSLYNPEGGTLSANNTLTITITTPSAGSTIAVLENIILEAPEVVEEAP